VAGGTIDAFCDQIVAGADQVGDVLVIFGATLIVWVVTDTWVEAPGLWTVPHTEPGRVLIGGPSNAGALFVDWARSLLRRTRTADASTDGRAGDPRRVPLWLPYLRGERVPFHDTSLRAGLFDLDITDGPSGISRAAYEASGFVVRNMVERCGITIEEARKKITAQCERSVLYPEFVLEFDNPNLRGCTVGDVLTNPYIFNEEALADPEADYEAYVADCDSRDAEDLRLHELLRRSTAEARRVMEQALAELLRHERIHLA